MGAWGPSSVHLPTASLPSQLPHQEGAGLESKPASSRWLWGKVPNSEALQTLLWRLPPKRTMRDKFS